MSLTDLPRALREITGKCAPYHLLYRMALNGDFPAERTATGRWRIRCEDVPGIAAKLAINNGERK